MMEYAMYHGEELLHVGTAEEIAEAHGIKKKTVYWYSMPAHQRRRSGSKRGNYITVVRLGDDDE